MSEHSTGVYVVKLVAVAIQARDLVESARYSPPFYEDKCNPKTTVSKRKLNQLKKALEELEVERMTYKCHNPQTFAKSPLFDRPTSHTNDPMTSYVAGDKVNRESWHKRILDTLECHDRPEGYTSKELAFLMTGNEEWQGLYFKIAKRMRELENKGMVLRGPMRISRVGGGLCQTWRAKK